MDSFSTLYQALMNALNERFTDSSSSWVCFALALGAHLASLGRKPRRGVLSSLCGAGIWQLGRASQGRFTAELPENLPPTSDRRPVLSNWPHPFKNQPTVNKNRLFVGGYVSLRVVWHCVSCCK